MTAKVRETNIYLGVDRLVSLSFIVGLITPTRWHREEKLRDVLLNTDDCTLSSEYPAPSARIGQDGDGHVE